MKLITHENCFLASAAMLLNVAPEVLIHNIGHDGTEVIDPMASPPFHQRGFHERELQDLFYDYGLYLIRFDRHLIFEKHSGGVHVDTYKRGDEKFLKWLRRPGIIIGNLPRCHAVATDGKTIFDPRGFTVDFESWITLNLDAITHVYLLVITSNV